MNFMLPALVFFPMAGAFVSYLIGRKNKNARNVFVCGCTAVEFGLAAYMLAMAASGKTFVFEWEGFCNLGLQFKLDGFRALYVCIAAFMWMMMGLFSPQYFAHYHNRNRYFFFTLLTLSATAGVFLSDGLYTTFIFFEIMSFTSYTWVAHEETPEAMRAAETYLSIAVVGGMVTLMGLFMMYHLLDTLSFDGLYAAGQTLSAEELYLPGALILFGFAAKAGMFPLHIWLPKAHPVAPAPASALLSGVLTKVGIFGVLVTSLNLFKGNVPWGNTILLLGTATMFGGALLAMFSVNLKRTLACSSMSQIGFILVGVGMQCLLGDHSALAARGTLLHMVNHSLIKLCLFMAAGVIYMNLHKLNLNDIRGFGRNKRILHFAFLMGALGISGVPLWNGYISKSLLHEGILEYVEILGEAGKSYALYKTVEWIFILTGGMTFSYMIKLYVAVFWEKNDARQEEFDAMRPSYLSKLSAFALLGSAIVLPALGMLPDILMTGMSELGAGFLHGGALHHEVLYFSSENLIGAEKSLVIGAVLYLAIIRPLLMVKQDGRRVYVDRWPKWLDIENIFIRSRFSSVILPGVITAVSRFLDGLATCKLFYTILPGILTAVTRVLDELADHIVILIGDMALSKKRTPKPAPVGTRLTYGLGRALNGIFAFLNYTVLKRHPVNTDFEYKLDVGHKEISSNVRMVVRSVSFGLLLLCVGIYVTCWYLLK